MTTKLIQLGADKHESGTAALQVTGRAVALLGEPDLCEIAIVQLGATERYLDPRDPDEPWKTTVYFLWPRQPRREGASLWFEIDHGVTHHLRANSPYKLHIRSLGGAEVEEVFTLPANTRRPSTPPVGWVPPPDPRGPVTAPQAVPQPPSVPAPVANASRPPAATLPVTEPRAMPPLQGPMDAGQPDERRDGGGRKWLIPVAVLALLAAGGASYLLIGGGMPGASTMSMDTCRQTVTSTPEATKAREQGESLAKDGKLLDCQLLLFKYAAEKGDVVAARHLGGFYDPDTWSKDKSPLPAPNPIEAARWHKKAADAGDKESLYRYGMLLKLGRTDESDGPEKAQTYLKKAMDAGHPLAKDAIAK